MTERQTEMVEVLVGIIILVLAAGLVLGNALVDNLIPRRISNASDPT